MEGLFIRSVAAVALSAAIAARAYKRLSLDLSGAILGFLVMAIHIAAGFGALLLVFFFTSSKLTKIGQEKKRLLEEDFKEGGQRNWVQVLANSAIATVLVVVVSAMTRGHGMCLDTKKSDVVTALIGGIIGHYACCNGDTWSSEIGILSKAQPLLVTNFKIVRRGTNGAVTLDGLLAAAAAGFVVGLSYVVTALLTAECASDVAWRQLLVIPIATAAGLLGSLIDSFLGATLQFSGYCNVRKKVVSKRGPTVSRISGMSILDNNAVNAVSVLLTTVLTAFACLYIF
ncbi:Transmembrane protein 19 [Ananas comosus]|uniref:Transmembrane protein 19 n=1 Tax=Ananas comosus TaxID=4615 RepID=A0A199WA34_ANACO|nr:Transmembrane protein 19 [Ananas comosus]